MLNEMRLRLFLLSLFFIAQSATANQQDYPFKLINNSESGGVTVMAQNNGPAPILLNLKLTSTNAIIEPPSPVAVVVKPAETIQVAAIHSAVTGQGYRIARSYQFSIGDPNAVHDPSATYRLPFKEGQAITVGQVWGGKIITHITPASLYAVDFVVPIGTPLVAARKGRVVDIDQNFTDGGTDPLLKANHVMILHEDGTLGLYSHLAANRIAVSFGQWVDAGNLIGYSGNTGYSTGPHLHFAVLTNTSSANSTARYLSHPVRFVNFAPAQEIALTQGATWLVHDTGSAMNAPPVYEGQRARGQQAVPVSRNPSRMPPAAVNSQ